MPTRRGDGNTGGSWDYLFVFSNVPAPRAADRVREAVRQGRRPLVVYFRRPTTPLYMEEIPGAHVVVHAVSFRKTEPRRMIDIIKFARRLRREAFSCLPVAECDVYADSLDTLAAVLFASRGHRCRVRYEVRDLHALQLARGLSGSLTRMAERLLLRRVDVLILTSRAFHDAHYRALYSGEVIVVENWPDLEPWHGFARESSREFVVGWVGVVRYLRCLGAVIRAVAGLRAKGVGVRLKIAGGGATAEVEALSTGSDGVQVLGPFQYDRDIRDIYRDVDLIYSVYDTDYENVRLAMPNKFYEALIAGIPILVASGTYLERRVLEAGIGVGVPCDDADAIARTIQEAAQGAPWYLAARRALGRTDIASLRRDHAAELARAVAG